MGFPDVMSNAVQDAARSYAKGVEKEITWKYVSKDRRKPKEKNQKFRNKETNTHEDND